MGKENGNNIEIEWKYTLLLLPASGRLREIR